MPIGTSQYGMGAMGTRYAISDNIIAPDGLMRLSSDGVRGRPILFRSLQSRHGGRSNLQA